MLAKRGLKMAGYNKPLTENLVWPGEGGPRGGTGGALAFGQAAQQASLAMGGKQEDVKVLQQVLQELIKSNSLLTSMESHAATNRYGLGA